MLSVVVSLGALIVHRWCPIPFIRGHSDRRSSWLSGTEPIECNFFHSQRLPISYLKAFSHVLFPIGDPKGAMLTHQNIVSNVSSFLKCMEVSGPLKKRSSLKCKSVLRF